MNLKKPTSFIIFIIVISITLLAILLANLFAYYQVDMKYSMLLALILFVAFGFTTVGIYSGFKFKTDDHKQKRFNRIGRIGNLSIFLIILAMMTYAALTNDKNSSSTAGNMDHVLCKKWKLVAYEDGGKRFETPEKFQMNRINFSLDHTVESSGENLTSVGDWKYDESQKTITIVDRVTGEIVSFVIKSINEHEFIIQIGKPEEKQLTLYMQPDVNE